MVRELFPPAADEYADYYKDYVEQARSRDILSLLRGQIETLHFLLDPLTDKQADYPLAPDEWTVKQVVGHLVDVERAWSQRLWRISRGDPTPVPGFDHDAYVAAAHFERCSIKELLKEFELLRQANILAIEGLSEEMLDRRGTASGSNVSVRALIYMLPGHVNHHLGSLHGNYLRALR
jgi:uncharacterized damage-inducible protein DinB